MRIITRGDFDGLVCSVLLSDVEKIDDISFVHPQMMQKGEVEVKGDDIIVNLPYHPDCALWFDHHLSESGHGAKPDSFKGKYGLAPSCARLIYDYYAHPSWKKYDSLMEAVDKIDSAQLSLNDILRPEGWVRLSCTVDPRTGFTPSRQYFMSLIEWIKELPLEKIMAEDEVRNRSREFFKAHVEFQESLKKHTRQDGYVVVSDFRTLPSTPIGSRFLVYALFPTAHSSIRAFRTDDKKRITIAVGHSIINRTCQADVGSIMAEYGGGGHRGAGSCQATLDEADDVIHAIVEKLNTKV
ncbi:MAG: exopolyphosphatase [Nitrospinae bacterium]|nr:exopolyphosphatase [Nitrospinota bacterium]MBF0633027.1 exopolyphosphatase [Nitrospinota bacterium]